MQRLSRFEAIVCSPRATVAEVLARIEQATPNLFQIVISEDGLVLGTITDGDIRRAMLQGVAMGDSVERCMRTTPILGRVSEDVTNRVFLRRAWFLPVVDTNGRLDHVLVQRRFEQPLNRALVMAGGFGRRLGELTRDKPKPLLPVGGRPILDRVIEQLETAGIASIHIAIHYKAEQIRTFIAQRINHAEITFIEGNRTARNRRCTGATFQPCRRTGSRRQRRRPDPGGPHSNARVSYTSRL